MNIYQGNRGKICKKNLKHIDTVFNIIQPLLLPITKTISNTHNNQRPQVDIFATNLSKYSHEYQYVVSDEISYSYDRTTSYTTDSVVFNGSKLIIGY